MRKQNNSGGSKSGNSRPANHTNRGSSTGLRMSDEKRSDVTKKPSSKNPYPNGLS